MRYGIPVTGDRVAPRCIFAESVLVVVLQRNRANIEGTLPLAHHSLLDLAEVLSESRIDVLVCGGISEDEREFIAARGVEVVDNVAGLTEELLEALRTGTLRSGFGLANPVSLENERAISPAQGVSGRQASGTAVPGYLAPVDCLACGDWKCLQGEPCAIATTGIGARSSDQETHLMLEAALDVSSEEERVLCRLSELIYFCLEMQYQRIGVAFCVDLREPAEILVRVLRRFIKVYPVCCKIGGAVVPAPPLGQLAEPGPKPLRSVACNPGGQAEVLNRIGTDLNVLVGLCMGVDCIVSRLSNAPVTTLFVKDKSLANNPIGAVYSDFYLKEAIQAVPRGRGEN